MIDGHSVSTREQNELKFSHRESLPSEDHIMSQLVTRQMVADKLAAYLQHELSRAGLVDWAEAAMMGGELDPQHFTAICDVVARLGVANVRTFGLTWDDCEHLLKQLGYAAHVQILAA